VTCGPCQRRALEETAEAFRRELVRRYGAPWFADREELVGRLSAALVARTPARATRLALVARWCADGLPRLEAWLAELDPETRGLMRPGKYEMGPEEAA
jgi:hypothetical protein